MPKRVPSGALQFSARAIDNMRVLRRARGWSVRELAERVTAAGFPVSSATLSQVDNGRRMALTVDELFALATVFDVTVEELVREPTCRSCSDQPAPAGFVCASCGRGDGRRGG